MKNLTIHPVELDGTAEYWLDTGELRNLGNLDQVRELHAVLTDLIDQGNHGGYLADDDPRIATWLTIAEAARETGLPGSSLRWACRRGYIEDARPNPWHVTLAAVEAWRAGPKAKQRPTK